MADFGEKQLKESVSGKQSILMLDIKLPVCEGKTVG